MYLSLRAERLGGTHPAHSNRRASEPWGPHFVHPSLGAHGPRPPARSPKAKWIAKPFDQTVEQNRFAKKTRCAAKRENTFSESPDFATFPCVFCISPEKTSDSEKLFSLFAAKSVFVFSLFAVGLPGVFSNALPGCSSELSLS